LKCYESYDRSWLPSRLLHVGRDSDNTPPTLHHRSSITRPALYTTLSHCWGNENTLQLTTTRLNEFRNGVLLSEFPATYRDAIILTRALELEYIWIDSICIIQDSPEDWREECTVMCDVYRNGILNIAALHAKDGNGGCFTLKDSNLLKPLVVRSYWPNFSEDTWLWTSMTTSRDDRDSTLSKRGWVFQESMLSSRVVGFGKKILTWRCREHSSSDSDLSTQGAGRPSTLYEGLAYDSPIDLFTNNGLLSLWNSLISLYSETSLSHAEDKLVAFSGIAKTCQHVLQRISSSEWTYLAGMWLPHLPIQLLWCGTGLSDQLTRPN
jgi:hypothetical protein